jgi:hypothetical protein
MRRDEKRGDALYLYLDASMYTMPSGTPVAETQAPVEHGWTQNLMLPLVSMAQTFSSPTVTI